MFTNAGICKQPGPAPAEAPVSAHPLERWSLWAKSSLPEWARGTPSARRSAPPGPGSRRWGGEATKAGQAEPRTRTSVSGWQCAPHFTLSRVLPHAPSHSQQASSHLHRAGGGGAKTGLRSQGTNPRRQPAQHLQDRGELRQPARPGDAAWHVRTAHHPWTKPGW